MRTKRNGEGKGRGRNQLRFIIIVIDEFRYIKIQLKTIDLSARLMGINPTNSVFIPKSLVLRSIVSG